MIRPASVGLVRFDFEGAIQVKVPLRAGRGGCGWLGVTVHPAQQPPEYHCKRGGAGWGGLVQGGIEATIFVPQPNQRLKLPAPAVTGAGFRRDMRCATLSFVNLLLQRRSLSAFR